MLQIHFHPLKVWEEGQVSCKWRVILAHGFSLSSKFCPTLMSQPPILPEQAEAGAPHSRPRVSGPTPRA